jgi:hypothetical protein
MTLMRDLHGRRANIAIHGDHTHTEALKLNRDFLAQLSRAKQHYRRVAQTNRHI